MLWYWQIVVPSKGRAKSSHRIRSWYENILSYPDRRWQTGFSEHINRYHHFFRLLAAPPSSLHITAFDQRGHGKTSHEPLTADSPQVIQWKKEGKKVKLEKNAKRVTGGWAKALPDIEWFVKRESEVAKAKGKKVFLSGFSMVCLPHYLHKETLMFREEEKYLLSLLDPLPRRQRRLSDYYLE
jgi:hypothetical protein